MNVISYFIIYAFVIPLIAVTLNSTLYYAQNTNQKQYPSKFRTRFVWGLHLAADDADVIPFAFNNVDTSL